jgi:RNA polymerase sigma-70 factor (ECF subfamily)
MADSSRQHDQLIARIAAGDEDAFSAFYRAHVGGVLAFLRKRVGDPELAFDLTAETFAAVVVGASSFSGDGPAVGWLYGIARNKLRESLRRGRIEDDARTRLGMERIVVEDEGLERVEAAATAGESQLALELKRLPELTRRALVSRIVTEREYSEIAAELECSEQVARQRVHRGLTRLRAVLKEAR